MSKLHTGFLLAITVSLITTSIFAATKKSNNLFISPDKATGNWFIAGYAGIEKPSIDNNFTVDNGSGYPTPYNLDIYSTKIHTTPNAAAEVGYRWVQQKPFLPAYSLGLHYQHIFTNDIGSQITQYSLSDFTNYTYRLDLNSDIFLLLAKVNLVEWHHFMPYISAGAGAAFTRAWSYSEAALPNVTARVSPGYQDNTTARFAYHVGAGIDWQMNSQFILSVDYNYQNLGGFTTGKGVSSWSDSKLSSGTFRSSSLMLGLNYLFDA